MASRVKSRVGSMKWRNETVQLAGEADKMTRKVGLLIINKGKNL